MLAIQNRGSKRTFYQGARVNFQTQAKAQERTDSDRLDQIAGALQKLVDLQAPGVPGVEGAQDPDELVIRGVTLADGQVWPISGNKRRNVLSIRNMGTGTLYLLRNEWEPKERGYPLEDGDGYDIKAKGTVYLLADGACDVRTLEEST